MIHGIRGWVDALVARDATPHWPIFENYRLTSPRKFRRYHVLHLGKSNWPKVSPIWDGLLKSQHHRLRKSPKKTIQNPRFCQLRSLQVDHLPQFALEVRVMAIFIGKCRVCSWFFMVNQWWCHQWCKQATVLYYHFILRPLDVNNRGKYPLSTP